MKDPAFLFYPNDYIGGTMGMTFEQKGAYMELLMAQFNRGHMTTHMIGQVLGQNSGQLWESIKDKFVQDDEGRYYNVRLEIEQDKRKAYAESRKNNIQGLNQYTKKGKNNSGHMDGHMTSHMENRNINESIDLNKGGMGGKKYDSEFEIFWDLYDKKHGDKSKIEKKWLKLNKETRQAILDYIPKYKICTPDKQFRKNPETFLNNRGWLDELIYPTPKTNGYKHPAVLTTEITADDRARF